MASGKADSQALYFSAKKIKIKPDSISVEHYDHRILHQPKMRVCHPETYPFFYQHNVEITVAVTFSLSFRTK
jgi:hypothetical protein